MNIPSDCRIVNIGSDQNESDANPKPDGTVGKGYGAQASP
jgi:hypothetical protein